MKVAILHDYLNQYGGAERVLEALLKIFPGADIYTLLYSKEATGGRFEQEVRKTSFLDFETVRNGHRPFIPLMPLAAKRMTISGDYDLVISDSAGFAKGMTIRHHRQANNPYHLSYCHTPLRYAWESESYFESEPFKRIFKPAFNYLKNWDYKAGQKPHALIANSKFIAGKIKEYYGREAKVIYPPVDSDKFYYSPRVKPGNYFLAVGRMLEYKRFDLIIEAFKELGLPLKIVGSGREKDKLKSQISFLKTFGTGNIEILDFVGDDELRKLYQGARALIFPQVEDFGLVAAEAIACGCPVIAYAAGGALEIVEDGKTGILFRKQEANDLISAVRILSRMRFKRKNISESAKKFSFENFKRGILAQIPEKIFAAHAAQES